MQISYLRYDVGHCHKGLYSFVKKALLKHPRVSLYKGQLAYSSFIHHTHMPSHLFGQIPNREKKNQYIVSPFRLYLHTVSTLDLRFLEQLLHQRHLFMK